MEARIQIPQVVVDALRTMATPVKDLDNLDIQRIREIFDNQVRAAREALNALGLKQS